MVEIPPDPPIQPGERIEHSEVTERITPASEVPTRRGTPMWAWVLPLVLVALFLTWYVLSRGEPSSPLGDLDPIEIDAPEAELPSPTIENNLVIEAPEAPAPAAEAPAAEAPSAEAPAPP